LRQKSNEHLKVEISSKPKITVISPVYRAEKIVDELVNRLQQELQKISDNYEILLVEDCGPDNSWKKIEENCRKDKRVKGIRLSRNFGQHYAISAGMQMANGEAVVIMDCDLQDDPVHIHSLYAKYSKENYDVVFTKRKNRRHSFFKYFTATLYNILFSVFSDKNYDVNVGTMVLFSERVKNEFNNLKDKDRLYIQLIKWVGFPSTFVTVEHNERFEGTSSYSFSKLIIIAIQGWTSHSDKLLRLSIYTGFAFSILAFLVGIGIGFMYFFKGFQPGWPSLFLGLLFSTGLVLMSIGVTGIYIGKIFEQVKERPLFIIDKKINI
jgi:glycosyltransferase involved in cell wall biosynthesis